VRLTQITEARLNQPVTLAVAAASAETSGKLFSSAATIRFTPVSTTVFFGDGAWAETSQQTSGFRVTHEYPAAGSYRAQAWVRFRVDYSIGTEPWVLAAAWVEVDSNSLLIEVLEPLRRTLLVPPQNRSG
jgi:hypothetical protein